MYALFCQIGRSSWTCLSISATNASPTVELRASSPSLRTVNVKRMKQLLRVSGVLQPMR